jgi:hypothetical protein
MAMLNNQMVNKAQIFHGSFRPRWLNGVAGHISEWWDVMRDRPIFCTFLWAWAGPTLSCCHSSCCQTRACPWCGDATLSPSIFECQRLQVAAWAFPLLQQWPKETSVRHICGVEPGCHVCCFSEHVPPPQWKVDCPLPDFITRGFTHQSFQDYSGSCWWIPSFLLVHCCYHHFWRSIPLVLSSFPGSSLYFSYCSPSDSYFHRSFHHTSDLSPRFPPGWGPQWRPHSEPLP